MKECEDYGHNVRWDSNKEGTPIICRQGEDPEQIFFEGTCRRCGHIIREFFRRTVCMDQFKDEECSVKESAVINIR